jgi:hypothetical protein
MQTQISDEMDASNLLSGGQIAKAVKSAIRVREVERFHFNESRDFTFVTVADDDTYTPSTEFIAIDLVEVLIGTRYEELERYSPMAMACSSATGQTGRPWGWAWYGDELQLYPTPNDVYTIRIHGHFKVAELSADSDTNIWTTDGEDMIREDAKAILYASVRRNVEDASISVGMAKGYADALRAKTSKLKATGRIKAWS